MSRLAAAPLQGGIPVASKMPNTARGMTREAQPGDRPYSLPAGAKRVSLDTRRSLRTGPAAHLAPRPAGGAFAEARVMIWLWLSSCTLRLEQLRRFFMIAND